VLERISLRLSLRLCAFAREILFDPFGRALSRFSIEGYIWQRLSGTYQYNQEKNKEGHA